MRIAAKSITGKVVDTKRVGTSAMGNPTYDVSIAIETLDGVPAESLSPVTVRTCTDSMIAYGITNPDYREQTHEYTLTPAGRIRNVRAV